MTNPTSAHVRVIGLGPENAESRRLIRGIGERYGIQESLRFRRIEKRPRANPAPISKPTPAPKMNAVES